MLNMLQFSNSRRHRHSVLELDKCAFGSNTPLRRESSAFIGHSSLASLPSSSSLNSERENISYNFKCLRNLKRSGIRITPEDVYQLRRELQADYAAQRTTAERRRCLRDACAMLHELRSELLDASKQDLVVLAADFVMLDACKDGTKVVHYRRRLQLVLVYNIFVCKDDTITPFFVFEYQAFLCWTYTTIRFAGFTSEMERHFREMKEHHRVLLSVLPPRGEPFLLAVLRFSQMCIDYAALCDDEALQWCRLAYARNIPRCKSSPSNTTRSASSLSSSSSSSDVEEVLARRDSERIASMLQDLRSNISEIELGMALSIGGSTREKLVY